MFLVIFLPSILIVIGIVFFFTQPKKINSVYGYRSKRSKKSIQSWKYANKLASKILIYLGLALFLVQMGIYLLHPIMLQNYKLDIILGYSTIILLILSFVLLIVIVEILLKKRFDQSGNPVSKA